MEDCRTPNGQRIEAITRCLLWCRISQTLLFFVSSHQSRCLQTFLETNCLEFEAFHIDVWCNCLAVASNIDTKLNDTNTRSIIDCQARVSWCQLHLLKLLWLNMVLVMDKLWLAQKSNGWTPLEFRSGSLFLPITPLQVLLSLPPWALKSQRVGTLNC